MYARMLVVRVMCVPIYKINKSSAVARIFRFTMRHKYHSLPTHADILILTKLMAVACRPSSGERNKPSLSNDERERRPRRTVIGIEETTHTQRAKVKNEALNYSQENYKKQSSVQKEKDKQRSAKNSDGKSKAGSSAFKPKEASSSTKEAKRAAAAARAAGELHKKARQSQDDAAHYINAKT